MGPPSLSRLLKTGALRRRAQRARCVSISKPAWCPQRAPPLWTPCWLRNAKRSRSQYRQQPHLRRCESSPRRTIVAGKHNQCSWKKVCPRRGLEHCRRLIGFPVTKLDVKIALNWPGDAEEIEGQSCRYIQNFRYAWHREFSGMIFFRGTLGKIII